MTIKYNPKKTLRFILLVNILAYMLFDILPTFIGALRFAVLILVVLFTFKKSRNNRVMKWQIAIVVYFLLSCLYTYLKYDFFSPVFGKLFISSLSWCIGTYLVQSPIDFLRLYKTLFLCLFLTALFLLLSNVLGFGTATGYSVSSGDINFGMSSVNIVKMLTVLVIMMLPLVFNKSIKHKVQISTIILIFVIAASLTFILLGFKRGAILSLTISLVVFTLIYKKKSTILLLGVFGVVFAFIFLSYFSKEFNQVKDTRLAYTDEVLSGDSPDARKNEAIMTLETAFSNGPLVLIFGNGMFSERFYYNTRRMHHTDYFTILHGGGLIGLILYFGIYLIVVFELRKNYKKSTNSYFNSAFYASAVALIFGMSILGVSGFLFGIDLRMYSFVFLGATFQFLKLGGIKDSAYAKEKIGWY